MMQEDFQVSKLDLELRQYVHPDLVGLIMPFSIALDPKTKERLARALAEAVLLIAPAVHTFWKVTVIFGAPPYYGIPVGTGVEFYFADMTQDPIATASTSAKRGWVYLDAQRIAALSAYPIDLAVLVVLEELVHVWMNLTDETIAKIATARLHDGGVVVHQGQYLPRPPGAETL
jgi:hypothetical protein